MPFILADNFEGYGKLIVGVIAVIFWAVSALSSMVKKANEQAKRNAAMRPAGPTPAPIAPAATAPAKLTLTPAVQADAARQREQAMQAQHAKQRKAVAKRAALQAPPPLPPVKPAPVVRAQTPAPAKPVVAPPMAHNVRAAGANAAAIRRWLTPGSVRKQFILTELFQPALALREPRKPV